MKKPKPKQNNKQIKVLSAPIKKTFHISIPVMIDKEASVIDIVLSGSDISEVKNNLAEAIEILYDKRHYIDELNSNFIDYLSYHSKNND